MPAREGVVRRRRSEGSLDTRQRLSDAALELFSLRGYNGTSVQDIVVAAGVPKGTFYNHFASKEALALDSVARYAAAAGTDLRADAGGSARERLAAHLDHLVALADTRLAYGCLLGNLATEIPAHSPTLADAVDRSFAAWIAVLAAVIAQCRQDGDLAAPVAATDPTELAGYVVSAYEGAVARAKAAGAKGPVEQFRRLTLDLLLR